MSRVKSSDIKPPRDKPGMSADEEFLGALSLNDARRRIKLLEESLSDMHRKYEKLHQEHVALQDQYRMSVEEVSSSTELTEKTSNSLDRRRAIILKSQIVQMSRESEALKDAAAETDGQLAETVHDAFKAKESLRVALSEVGCVQVFKVMACIHLCFWPR
jgi:predicted  nucleic acid-binding Zn-ribbon protein